jgi:hypothetical protein
VDPDAVAFAGRFLGEVRAWCNGHRAEVQAIGGEPSEWEAHLIKHLAASDMRPPTDPEAAQQLLAKTIFSPLTATSQERCQQLARELAAEMEVMIVRASDRWGAMGALYSLLHGEIGRIEALAQRLDPAQRRDADPALVTAYLTKLIRSLNRDNWSARELEGAAPASLSAIQQRLTFTRTKPGASAKPVLVDDLVEKCDRLVILGGPGAGKTWTARRAAIRTAEAALDKLAAGAALEQVRISLFAACSEVLERGAGTRWDRLIDAALEWAHSNPGHAPRLRQLLRDHQRLLVVLDGLDEAANPQNDALYQLIDAHQPGGVRLVLTSRPGSWNSGLLQIEQRNERHQVGDLEPFTPHDVRSAVAAWLADVPDTRDRLLQRLQAPNSSLSRQASVPLLCAMFCIVARPDPHSPGDTFDLFEPGRRLDLYDTVIAKLLFGTWRDTPEPTDDLLDDAIPWLECLAVTGKIDDPATGLGNWPDAIEPPQGPPPGAAPYVSHVAAPNPRRAPGRQTRTFVHRSLREHLTAKALNHQEPAAVAAELLPHLWFDPDWLEVIPAVLAGHPQADQLVTELARLAGDITTSDPSHALEDVLVRAAALTTPDPHTPRRTEAINDALTTACNRTPPKTWHEPLASALHWPATNSARTQLLDLLADPNIGGHNAVGLAEALVGLGPTRDQAQRASDRLLDLLADPSIRRGVAPKLAEVLASLRPTSEVIDRILELVANPRARAAAVVGLAEALAGLGPTPDQAQRAIDRLVQLLNTPGIGRYNRIALAAALARAGRTSDAIDRLLDMLDDPGIGRFDLNALTDTLANLGWTQCQAHRAIDRVLDMLDNPGINPYDGFDLAKIVARFGPTPAQAHRARLRVLEMLDNPGIDPGEAGGLAFIVATLRPTPDQAQRTSNRVLDLLDTPSLNPYDAAQLAGAMAMVGPQPDQAQRGCRRVLEFVIGHDHDADAVAALAGDLAELGATSDQRQRCGDKLVDILAIPGVHPSDAADAAKALTTVGPTLGQAQRAAAHVLDVLARPGIHPYTGGLAEALSAFRETLRFDQWAEILAAHGPASQ